MAGPFDTTLGQMGLIPFGAAPTDMERESLARRAINAQLEQDSFPLGAATTPGEFLGAAPFAGEALSPVQDRSQNEAADAIARNAILIRALREKKESDLRDRATGAQRLFDAIRTERVSGPTPETEQLKDIARDEMMMVQLRQADADGEVQDLFRIMQRAGRVLNQEHIKFLNERGHEIPPSLLPEAPERSR